MPRQWIAAGVHGFHLERGAVGGVDCAVLRRAGNDLERVNRGVRRDESSRRRNLRDGLVALETAIYVSFGDGDGGDPFAAVAAVAVTAAHKCSGGTGRWHSGQSPRHALERIAVLIDHLGLKRLGEGDAERGGLA